MKIYINPGTESIRNGEIKNAVKAAKYFLEDLKIDGMQSQIVDGSLDDRGWVDFKFFKDNFEAVVSFPSSDPDITRKGKAWESPRIYINGSSWLWGFGLQIMDDLVREKSK